MLEVPDATRSGAFIGPPTRAKICAAHGRSRRWLALDRSVADGMRHPSPAGRRAARPPGRHRQTAWSGRARRPPPRPSPAGGRASDRRKNWRLAAPDPGEQDLVRPDPGSLSHQPKLGERVDSRPGAPPQEHWSVVGTGDDYADTPRNWTPPHQTQPLTEPLSPTGAPLVHHSRCVARDRAVCQYPEVAGEAFLPGQCQTGHKCFCERPELRTWGARLQCI